jgi:hypothetical protein
VYKRQKEAFCYLVGECSFTQEREGGSVIPDLDSYAQYLG